MSETPTSSTPSCGEALSGNTAGGARAEIPAVSTQSSPRSSATPTSGIEASTQNMEMGTSGSATPADSEAAPGRQSATPPVASSDEQRPRAARSERKTVRIRIPDGWGRSLLAGVEGALLGWALSTTLVLVTYLGVSDNPWMGKISWDDAMAVGSDLWAMSLGSSLTVDEVTFRAVPLLMTVLAVVLLRLLLVTGRNFPASALWFAVPAYMGTTALLVGSNTTHHSWPATMVGAFVCSMLAAAWAALGQTRASYRKACVQAREANAAVPEPPRILQIPEWLRVGLRQGAAMIGIVVGASLLALMAAVFMRWENVVAIADLLQPATTVDTTMLAIAQSLFVPTAGAWLAAWGAGPGIVLGPDTVHSLTSAPIAPIPPVPFLGVLPASPVGVWMVVVPLTVGLLVGVLFVWRGRVASLREQAYALGVAGGVFALFVSAWMWLSVLTLGEGRMVGIGPRLEWVLPALLGEVLGVGALVVLVSHPTVLAWMQGRRADAHEALASSSFGQKIRAGRVAHEGKAEAGPGEGASSGMAEGSTGLEARASRTEALNPDDIPTEVFSMTEAGAGDAVSAPATAVDSADAEAEALESEGAAEDTAAPSDPSPSSASSSASAPGVRAEDDASPVDTGSLYATARRPRPQSDADNIPTIRIPRIEEPSDD